MKKTIIGLVVMFITVSTAFAQVELKGIKLGSITNKSNNETKTTVGGLSGNIKSFSDRNNKIYTICFKASEKENVFVGVPLNDMINAVEDRYSVNFQKSYHSKLTFSLGEDYFSNNMTIGKFSNDYNQITMYKSEYLYTLFEDKGKIRYQIIVYESYSLFRKRDGSAGERSDGKNIIFTITNLDLYNSEVEFHNKKNKDKIKDDF